MSESEQTEAPQRTEDEWVELTSELAEVRKKLARLDSQNLRVTDNLRRTIEEREQAVAQLESLRAEYLAAKESVNTNSDKAAALREQLVEMTTSRDNFERLCKEWRIAFDALSAKKEGLQVQLSQWQVEQDAAKEELAQAKEAADMFKQENASLQDTVCQLRAKQVDADLPGILMVIQAAAQQARELI